MEEQTPNAEPIFEPATTEQSVVEQLRANPANPQMKRVTEASRIPMGGPEQQLAVPEIEGYVLHWFLDSPGRIPRALAAGWEFVEQDEVQLNNRSYASDPGGDGNSDLGSRVSVYGSPGERGEATRQLYLMKIRKDWYDADMKLRQKDTDAVVEALRGGKIGVSEEALEDRRHRYSNVSLGLKRSS